MASSEVNTYNIDNNKRIFPSSGMIDRASAVIQNSIMRLKRKDAKKPPEVPPKPAVLNSSGNNGHNNHNQQSSIGNVVENGVGSSSTGTGTGTPNGGSSQWGLNRHGGIAVLPQHITTLTGNSGSLSMGQAGSLSSTPQTPRKFPTLQKKTPRHKKLLTHHSQLWTDEDFLKTFFTKYFSGSEKLVLPMVCRKWRDVTYGLGRVFWGDLIPVLKCKELRGVRADLKAGIRRRFYAGLVKRG